MWIHETREFTVGRPLEDVEISSRLGSALVRRAGANNMPSQYAFPRYVGIFSPGYRKVLDQKCQ
jgi:hypothetical protein